MASQSLYRKWRSQTFDELVGQEHVIQTLRNAIVEDRVAHALLFTGPRGVGKTSMARLVAKAVNCTAPAPQRPCGVCATCVAIAEGRAVDVIEMDAASHTSVDDARELIERVQFRPAEARCKVYVIDEVHMLSTAAFNALLKTLEEPPAHALFILATTEAHKVPATILSRCQRFTFTRHTIAQIADHLRRIGEREGTQLDPGVPEAIARAATGSMRDALGTLEQASAFGSGHVTLEQIQRLLGTTRASEVDGLVEALLARSPQAALRLANSVADQGADIRQFTRDLVERLRLVMMLAATGDTALIGTGTDDLALLQGWAAQATPAELVRWIRLFSNLDYQLRTSTYGHLPLELALVEALVGQPAAEPARVSPAASPARAPAREPAARARPPAPPAPAAPSNAAAPPPPPAEAPPAEPVHQEPPAPAPAAPPPPPAATRRRRQPDQPMQQAVVQAVGAELSILDQVQTAWPEIVRGVRPQNNRLEAILKDVHPYDVDGTTIVLQARSTFHYTQVEKPHNRQIVEQVVSSHLGGPFTIRCVHQEQPKADDTRSQLHERLKDDYVRAVRNIFAADVIDFLPNEPD